MQKTLLMLSLLFATTQAPAEIYRCKSPSGSLTLTDAKTKENFKFCALLVPSFKSPPPQETEKNPTPNHQQANIDKATQQQRDEKRKQILLSELEDEQRALESAKGKGASTEINAHQKNIELLKKEISLLK